MKGARVEDKIKYLGTEKEGGHYIGRFTGYNQNIEIWYYYNLGSYPSIYVEPIKGTNALEIHSDDFIDVPLKKGKGRNYGPETPPARIKINGLISTDEWEEISRQVEEVIAFCKEFHRRKKEFFSLVGYTNWGKYD